MTQTMPQEIAVWYVIPSLRKELAKEMLKYNNLNQKEVSTILGITEAAVSQYITQKRAVEIKFSKDAKQKISETAKLIIADPKNSRTYIYRLSNLLMKTKEVCKLHMARDKTVNKNCKICFE